MRRAQFFLGRRPAMRLLDWTFGIFAAAAILWIAAGATAQKPEGPVALDKLLPPETLLYVSMPDMGTSREDWKTTAMNKIWEEPEVQHAVDTLLGNFQQYVDQFEEQFKEETGVELDSALDMLKGQLSIALVEMPTPENKRDVPVAAAALDFGENKAVLEKLLTYAVGMLKEGSPGIEEGSWEHGDKKILTLGDEELKINWMLTGSTLYLTTDKALMEGMLGRLEGADLPSLAGNETYRKVLSEIAPEGKPSLFVYADVQGWLDTMKLYLAGDEESAAEMNRILDALGTKSAEAGGLAVSFSDQGVRDRIYLHMPGPREGLMRILSPGVTAMPYLAQVPADAISFAAMRVDLASTWDRAMEILKKADEEAWTEVTEEIRKFEEKAGVKVREDLLGAMGNEVASWSAFPRGGGVIPNSVTMVTLKDPVAFEGALKKLYSAAGMERKELEWNGQKIRYFVSSLPRPQEAMPGHEGEVMPGPDMGGMGGFGPAEMIMMNLTSFSAYFVEGSTLYTSMLVQTLKDMIRSRGDKTSHLTDTEGFKKMRAMLPENPGMVLYYDLESTFYLVYNSLLPILQYAEVFLRRQFQVPFETAALPSAHAIAQHLAPSVTAVADRPGGVLISSYSKTGVTTATLMGVAGVGVAAAVAIPMFAGGKEAGSEVQAMAMLKSIATGQEQFRFGASVDQDVDGQGEYGLLQELAGTSNCRTAGGLEGPNYAASPFIPAHLGLLDGQGRAVVGGYYIKVFLPGEKEAIKPGLDVAPGLAAVADNQEKRWCAYAWPVEAGRTGTRSFFINQEGVIYQAGFAYSGDRGPEPGAAYAVDGPAPANLDGPVGNLMAGKTSVDGNNWMPLD